MKSIAKYLVAVVLAVGPACAAHAQTASLLGAGDLKVGVFNPSNNDAREISGNALISIGADYSFPSVLKSLLPDIYADYQGGSHGGGHINTFGIGVAGRYQVPGVRVAGFSPYVGLGVGAYQENINTTDSANSGTSTTLGGKAFAGLTFNHYLVEVNYQLLTPEHGINPSGVGLQIGVTF